MRHAFQVRVGPFGFRVGSDWRPPVERLRRLYAGYPAPDGGVADFTVRLEAPRPWRRVVRPQVLPNGDHHLPGAVPLPLAHALLAAEMGMNLQVALGSRRFLLLHAAACERDGRAVVLTGESGAGKSTLSVLLAAAGWRFMADEFALLDTATGAVHPFPRPVSLKNEGVTAAAAAWPDAAWGPWLRATPKGDVRHMAPPAAAVAAAGRPAAPALLVFPRFGHPPAARPVGAGEAFARLTGASTNYTRLGEAGFRALTRLVRGAPAVALDYPDGAAGVAAVEAAWARAG